MSTHNQCLAPELGRRCVILWEDRRVLFDGPVEEALANGPLLVRADLVHGHRHRHGALSHSHYHIHDWD